MIYMNYCLLSHQVMLPFFNTLYQHIQFLVIFWIVNYLFSKSIIIIRCRFTSLHQDFSHGISDCISFNLKWLLQFLQSQKWCGAYLFLQYLEGFWSLSPHWNTCFILVNACRGDAMKEKLAMNFLQYFISLRSSWLSWKNLSWENLQ